MGSYRTSLLNKIRRRDTMKNTGFILLYLLATLFSCSEPARMNTVDVNSDTTNTKIGMKGGADSFLALFSEVAVDTFHVYSEPNFYDDPKFRGKKIEEEFNYLFAFDTVLTYSLVDEAGPKDRFYACYKFKFTSDKTGLLIRIPSQYDVTAVDLFIWDNKKRRIERRESLSDAFGDEGWHFVQDAWILDFNRDGLFDILTRRKDHNVDIDDTTKVPSSDSTFIFLGNTFRKQSLRIDTSEFQLKKWIP